MSAAARVVVPLLLAFLAIVDSTFAGYRASAGRNGRVFKLAYTRRAIGIGAVVGVAIVAVLAGATAAVLAGLAEPAAVFDDLVGIGARMLEVFVVYAALVLGALALYMTAAFETQVLSVVVILGPFTFLRPAVIAAAAAWGLCACHSAAAAGLTLASCSAMLVTGWALDRAYARPRVSRAPVSVRSPRSPTP